MITSHFLESSLQDSGFLNVYHTELLILFSKIKISGQFWRLCVGYTIITYRLLSFIGFLILPSLTITYSGSTKFV